MKINLLATNAYKVAYEDVNTFETVDQLKIRLFRDHSDHMPMPSNIYEDIEVLNPSKDVEMTSPDSPDPAEEDEMNIDNTNLSPQLLHPHQLRLIFGGRQLESLSTMQDNGITDGCTILVAVSPFYLVRKQLANEAKPKPDNFSSTDRLYTMVDRNNKIQFQLALDDQVGDESSVQFSKLTELSTVEASQLLMRVPALESEDITNNNNNSNEQFKLYQSKPPKVGTGGLFSIIKSRARAKDEKEKEKEKEDASLEGQFDQLSLAPLGRREQAKRTPISVISQTPTGSNLTVYQIQVVFNRPFIPLCSTLEELKVPFLVEPAVPDAEWRWIDGVTCCYSNPKSPYSTLFARSTNYRVYPLEEVFKKYEPEITEEEIPMAWSFETSIQYPMFGQFNGDILNPQINIQFSQSLPLDQYNNIANNITIKSNGNKAIKCTLLTIDSPNLCSLFKDSLARPKKEEGLEKQPEVNTKSLYLQLEKLDMQMKYFIKFNDKLGSAEGPLKTHSSLEISFRTPDPLRVTKVSTDYEGDKVMITFNNQVDKITLDNVEKHFVFKPAVQVKGIRDDGFVVTIEGNFIPSLSYSVHVSNITSPKTTPLDSSRHEVQIPKDFAFIDVDSSYSHKFNLDPLSRPFIKLVSRGVSYVKIESHRIEANNALTTEYTKLPRLLNKEIQIKVIPRKQTCTFVDLTDFFGGSTPFVAKNNLLMFRFSSKNTDGSIVETWKLLQYSPFMIALNQTDTHCTAWVTNVSTQIRVKTPLIETYADNSSFWDYEDTKKKPNISMVLSDGLFSVPKDKSFSLLVATVTIEKTRYVTVLQTNCQKYKKKEEVRWDINDALGCYRPTETVYIKGNLRIANENGILTPLEHYGDNTMSKVTYKLTDTRKKVNNTGSASLNINGGFNFSFVLPADINLGDCSLTLECGDSTKIYPIKVQECKRKDFIVDSEMRKPVGNIRCGQPFYVLASGRYFNDEIMANTKVDWSVSVGPAEPDLPYGFRFSPVNDPDRSGTYQYNSKPNPSGRHQLRLVLEKSKLPVYLGVNGSLIDLTNKSETFSHSTKIYGSYRHFGVSKSNDQFVNISESFKTTMVATNSAGKLVSDGKIHVDIKMVPWEDDLPKVNEFSGELVPSKVEPTAFSYTFKKRGAYCITLSYEYEGQEVQKQSHNIFVLGEQTEAEKEFKTNDSKTLDQYQDSHAPVASISEEKYQVNLELLVNGKSETNPKLGDKLDMLVTCKLQSGMGMISLSKSKSLVRTTPFKLTDGQFRFEHIVTEEDFPTFFYNVFVEGVASVKQNNTIVERYTTASTLKTFTVDRETKNLFVEFLPYRKFQSPNSDISITTRVLDYQKKPVSTAEVTLIVADESLLSLTRKTANSWNPLDLFYNDSFHSQRSCSSLLDLTMFCTVPSSEEVSVPLESVVNITVKYLSGRIIQMSLPLNASIDEVRKVVLERDGLPFTSQRLLYKNKQVEKGTLYEIGITSDDTLNLVIRLSGGGDNDEKEDLELLRLPAIKQIKVRDNFKPLATFESNRFTDDNGEVKFDFKLPDNLTKYRVMAFACTSQSFGKNQEFFTSTLPVMIRQNPPRFLNYNDECTFPVVISNIVDYDVEVNCAFQTTNCLTSSNGFKSVIPANSRIIAPFQVKAVTPNVKSFYHVVLASRIINAPGVEAEFTDAVKFDFPVYSPSSIESNTVSGFTEEPKIVSAHPVKFNNWEDFDQELGGLSVNLATTNITQISASYEYLMNYQHSCSEQIASKLLCLGLTIKLPELIEMDKDRPSNEKIKTTINEMLEKLKARLLPSGAFKYWDSPNTYEYVNVYVYWVLDILLNEFGFTLPSGLMDKAAKYLASASEIDKSDKEYSKHDKDSYLIRKAFALYVHARVSKTVRAEINRILVTEANSSTSPIAADLLSILLPIASGSVARQFARNLENKLVVTGSVAFFDNSTSISGFSSVMRTSCWAAQALLAEKQSPQIIAKLMAGITAKIKNKNTSMWFNTQDNAMLMYTLYLYYGDKLNPQYEAQVFLNNFSLEPKPFEINSSKTLYNKFIPMKTLIKNQGDLLIQKKGQGDLHYSLSFKYAKKNPFYRAVENRGFILEREFLPLGKPEDIQQINTLSGMRQLAIKSGARIKIKLTIKAFNISTFVIINDYLPAGLEPINSMYSNRTYWTTHSNIRDKGAEIFADFLYPGTYTFTYNVQALCHGTYICPPARMEEMYCPSTFARTATDTVIII